MKRVARAENDEFTCTNCGGVFNNDHSVQTEDKELVCEFCAEDKEVLSTGKSLKTRGFDNSTFDHGLRMWSVKCSKCKALVIDGKPTHADGCPKTKEGN